MASFFWIIQPAAVADPTGAQVTAGLNGSGSAATAAGSVTDTGQASPVDAAADATGLTPGASYELFWVHDLVLGTVVKATFSASLDVALSGQSVTASAGTLIPNRSIAQTGQAVTVSAGTVSPNRTIALSGQAVTASAGTVTAAQGVTVSLTGAAVTASAGTLTNSTTIALSGHAVTASAGTVTYNAGNNITLALSGQAVTASAGTLGVSVSTGLSGSAVTASSGTLAPEVSKGLAGQSLTATAGTLTYSADQSLTIALTGQSVSVEAGTITVVGGTSAVSQVGAPGPGRRNDRYVAYINGQRIIGSLPEIQAAIDEFTQSQIETAEKTLKPPKKARIVVQAGKPAKQADGKPAEKPASAAVMAVQAEARQYYDAQYERAMQFVRQAIESARLEDEDDDEVMLLL